jgi:hypothetical protein
LLQAAIQVHEQSVDWAVPLSGLRVEPFEADPTGARLDLTLDIFLDDTVGKAWFFHDPEVLDRATVEGMAASFCAWAERVVTDGTSTLGQVAEASEATDAARRHSLERQ